MTQEDMHAFVMRLWQERAEKRAGQHYDWKKDVTVKDGGHCWGIDDPHGTHTICKEEAKWTVDNIDYCDRHLVQSER